MIVHHLLSDFMTTEPWDPITTGFYWQLIHCLFVSIRRYKFDLSVTWLQLTRSLVPTARGVISNRLLAACGAQGVVWALVFATKCEENKTFNTSRRHTISVKATHVPVNFIMQVLNLASVICVSWTCLLGYKLLEIWINGTTVCLFFLFVDY